MKKKIGVGFVLLFIVGISLFILKPVKNKISDRNIASAPGHQTTPEEYKSIRPAVHLHHYAVTGVPEGYTPAQIRNAYQIGQSLGTGAGQTIALIEAMGNPNIQSDLDIFCAQFQIPSTTVQVYYSQGSPSVIDPVWALETSLDVEWAHAIAPAANIIVVVAQAGSFDDLLGAVDQAVSLGANEISMSWGAAEFPTETQLDYHFDISKAIFFASAGDGGAGVSWPAASTQVNAVGGTTLYLDNSGNLTSPEVGWANGGGGQSVYEIETNYQNVVQNSGYRTVPDVGYNADPNTGFAIYDSIPYLGNTGWFQVGGTSAGAPQWAALFALSNSLQTSAPYLALPSLYSFAGSQTESLYLRDVASGCDGTGAQDCAHVGYDQVTGLGSPLTGKLMTSLWGYKGCYTDSNPSRALSTELATSNSTVESCVLAAQNAGYSYAGIQYGGQCFGGNNLGYSKVPDSSCNMPCTSNSKEICGGANFNSIYSTNRNSLSTPPPPAPVATPIPTPSPKLPTPPPVRKNQLSYLGCYTDSNSRALPRELSFGKSTIESCLSLAKTKNFNYAGLQYGGQCFAGNRLGYKKVADSRCSMPCSANTKEKCGGSYLNSIYKTGK